MQSPYAQPLLQAEEPYIVPGTALKRRSENYSSYYARRIWHSGPLIISIAALICSTIPLFVKQLDGAIPSTEITVFSSSISWTLTHVWLYLSGEDMTSLVTTGKGSLLALRGILGGAVQCLYYQAITLLPISEAVSLFFTNPAFAVLLDWVINGKEVKVATALGCLAAMGGVFLVVHPSCCFFDDVQATGPWQWQHLTSIWLNNPLSSLHTLGVLLAVAAAIANAVAFVNVQAIGPSVPFVVLMWFYHSLATAAAAASFIASGQAWVWPQHQQIGWVLGVAGAHFLGQLLLNRGFQQADASHGASIFSQQVFYSYVWNLAIMRQPLQLCAALGSGLILTGVVTVSESGGVSHAEKELERKRSSLSLERRESLGRLSFIDRIMSKGELRRRGSEPLLRHVTAPVVASLMQREDEGGTDHLLGCSVP